MKRLVILTLPLLLLSCAETKHYINQVSGHMQDDCTTRPTFGEVFTCTQNRLYNDPISSIAPNPAMNAEVTAYGEQLNSQLRQGLITDMQASQAFAQKLATVKASNVPLQAPPGRSY